LVCYLNKVWAFTYKTFLATHTSLHDWRRESFHREQGNQSLGLQSLVTWEP